MAKFWRSLRKHLPEIGIGAAALGLGLPLLAPGLFGLGAAAEGVGGALAAGEGAAMIGGGALEGGAALGLDASGMALGGAEAAGAGASLLGDASSALGAADPLSSAFGSPMGLGAGGLGEAAPGLQPSGLDPFGTEGPGIGSWETAVTPAADLSVGGETAVPALGGGEAGGAGTGAGTGGGAAAGDQSVFGKMGSVLGSPALKYGLPIAMLGGTLLRGQQGLPPQARQAQGIAQQEGEMASEFLKLGQAGQITPAQAAQIQIFRQNSINMLRQQYANAGRNPQTDSSYLEGVRQIEQQATAMQQQFVDSLIKQGLAAAGGATAALNQVAQMQIQEDRNFQAAIGDAVKAFAYVSGSRNTRMI